MKRNSLLLAAITLFTLLVFQACEPDEIVTIPTISALNCSTATISTMPMSGKAFNGRATIAYAGGNGVAYVSDDTIASNGVLGLKANLVAGFLSHGNGTIAYSISGTPTSAGTATFPISVGGQSCVLEVTVMADTTTPRPATGSVGMVLAALDTFKRSLSATQLAALQLPLSQANATNWSVLTGATRNGLEFNALTEAQLIAAKAVIAAATGTTPDEGYSEFIQITLADDVLAGNGGGTAYSSKKYSIAILGTPSQTGTWMLQFGGHNYVQHITYSNGAVVGTTPSFQAVEPKSWLSGTISYAPLDGERDALKAMLAGLTPAQLALAHATSTMSDLLLGPKKDGAFPTTKAGLPVSSLNAVQKELVLVAMKPWLLDADDVTSKTMLSLYETELDQTYIYYAGDAALSKAGDYVRIDGPSVWIEFICTPATLTPADIQYRSIYRDRKRDYGNIQ